jgi:uncharacterized membrane protein
MRTLSFACTIWFALMAGFFFAFSAVALPGLDRLSPEAAARAMQAINAAVANPVFAIGFWGAAVLAIVSMPVALVWRPRGWALLLAAGACYLVGVLSVTAIGNVPLNRELAEISDAQAMQRAWPDYAATWGWLNHLRMISAIAAAALALGALVRLRNAGGP